MESFSTKKIIETESFEEILEHLTPDTAIFCDLDNTLLESCQHFGTVQWFEHYEKKLLDEGKSPIETERFLQLLWNELLPKMSVRLLDDTVPNLLRDLQMRGHLVLGLTARYPMDAEYTHLQLQRLGIQFDQRYSDHDMDLEHPAIFHKGIIYASSFNRKSAALLALLKQIDYYPPNLIFIDDKMSHVQDLELFVPPFNINYVGVRYGKADKRVKEYDPQIAQMQMKLFPEFISDEQAKQLLVSP